MKRFKKECFELSVTIDERNSRILGYFTDQYVAQKIGKGAGWYGSDGTVKATTLDIKIYESEEEYLEDKKENKREKALAKLTNEEKRLLGL